YMSLFRSQPQNDLVPCFQNGSGARAGIGDGSEVDGVAVGLTVADDQFQVEGGQFGLRRFWVGAEHVGQFGGATAPERPSGSEQSNDQHTSGDEHRNTAPGR